MQPNIFKIMNDNILAISEDLNEMHRKVDALMSVFYQESQDENELPKVDGEAPVKL
jgi:hypothetical protein